MKLFLQHSENSAVGYYRVWQPAKWLQKLGLAEVRRLPDDQRNIPTEKVDPKIGYSLSDLIKWADLMSFQRIDSFMGLAAIDMLIDEYKKPVVLELDDDLIHLDRFHPQYDVFREKSFADCYEILKIKKEEIIKYRSDKSIVQVGADPNAVMDCPVCRNKEKKRVVCPQCGGLGLVKDDRWLYLCRQKDNDIYWLTVKTIRKATALTVSTEVLADVYRPYNPNIYVLKNAMDFEMTDALPRRRRNDNIIIGWAGGGQHVHDIKLIVPALDIILKKYPAVRFHWAGCMTKETRWLQRRYPNQTKYLARSRIQQWWSTYADWNFDIGLAPLRRSRFNSGKSNIKWLENASRRIPTVASRIECYSEIQNGETGFYADTTKEWAAALAFLTENESERERAGQNAYDYCKAHYNAKDNAGKYAKAYRDIINKEADNAVSIRKPEKVLVGETS